MTVTTFTNGTTLTAAALNTAYGECLAADGSQAMTGALVAPGATLTDNALIEYSATAWNGVYPAPKEAGGLVNAKLSLAGLSAGNDTLIHWAASNADLRTSGTITAVGASVSATIEVGSYTGDGNENNTPPNQWSALSGSAVQGPGALLYNYFASQNDYTYPNDGIGSFSTALQGAQAWCQYLPLTQLLNQPTNINHGAAVMSERDLWTNGADILNERWLHGQVNAHLHLNLGYNIYPLATAQSVAGPTLVMPSGNTYVVGQAVTGSNIPSGTVIIGVSGSTLTLSASTTAALAANTQITIGNSYPATCAFGLYWELDPGVALGAYLTADPYLVACIDTRNSGLNTCNVIANAATNATTLRVSNVQLFTYAGYYADAYDGATYQGVGGRVYCQPHPAGTYGSGDPGNFLTCTIYNEFGSPQTVQVDGWAFDGPGLVSGTITLASGLPSGFTDAGYTLTLSAAAAAGATTLTFTTNPLTAGVSYDMPVYGGVGANGNGGGIPLNCVVTNVTSTTVTISPGLCGAMAAGATVTFCTGAVTIRTNAHPIWMADGQTIALDAAGAYTIGKDTTRNLIALGQPVSAAGGIAAFGKTPPTTAAVITGSRSGATATVLESVLQALQSLGFLTDSTTT